MSSLSFLIALQPTMERLSFFRITIPEGLLPPGTIGILVMVTHCTSGFASTPYVLHDHG